MALVKIHSHPGGGAYFSALDDISDGRLFPSVHGWMDDGLPQGSAIMLPDGSIMGRVFDANGKKRPLDFVMVVGDDLQIWQLPNDTGNGVPEFARRNAQTFGAGTYAKLSRMRIAVVGCSGTGSVVVEQLARYGVGHLVLVDPDTLEAKNLNRILNTSRCEIGQYKVEVLKKWIGKMGLETTVGDFATELAHPEAVKAVAGCDVVFGCVDSIDGRHLLNRLATFYLLPYFDVGVKLEADGEGGITQICGTVHYIQPGRSSLLTRKLYTRDQYRAATLHRRAPEAYADLASNHYIAGVAEDRPAVISVNMAFSALAVLEFLARLHPYRDDPNSHFASLTLSLTGGVFLPKPEREPDPSLQKYIGRGDMEPLLDTPLMSLEETT